MTSDTCKNCGRAITAERPPSGRYHGRVVRATVQHEGYGCDTGCCGHVTYGYDVRGNEVCYKFHFSHPDSNSDEDTRRFAEECISEIFGPGVTLDMDKSSVWDN